MKAVLSPNDHAQRRGRNAKEGSSRLIRVRCSAFIDIVFGIGPVEADGGGELTHRDRTAFHRSSPDAKVGLRTCELEFCESIIGSRLKRQSLSIR